MKRITVALLVFLTAGFAGAFVAKRMANPTASITTTISSMFSLAPDPQTVFHKDRIAILLLGIDYNYSDKDQEYSTGARSDSIMAMSLDFPTRSLHILSIPRDMKYTFADGHSDKINAAYSIGGPHTAQRAVANFLGIPEFDRYIVLRVSATKSLIDAIGGIDVPVSEAMNYDDTWGHLHIHFTPGLHHMNGEQAVSYSRFRHDACSDPCRIKRQQQVMRITIAKLKTDKFNDLTHIHALIDVVNKNVESDLSTTEKISLAQAYSSFNIAGLKTEQVPYVGDEVLANAGDVLIPDDTARAKLVRKLFVDPVPTPAPSVDQAALAAIDVSTIRVAVQNGSGIPGLGKSAADLLKLRGFQIESVQNADASDHTLTEIHVASTIPFIGERVRKELKLSNASVIHDSSAAATTASPEITLIVGSDYESASGESYSRQYGVMRSSEGRIRILIALIAITAMYVSYRLFMHSSALLQPAVVTPKMQAHQMLAPSLDARVYRLTHEHISYQRENRQRLIALTFDDGPYAVTTPLLLDVLNDLHVPATFFLIGRDALLQPELTRRIVAGGFEVANHTYSHPNLDALSPDGVRSELVRGTETLRQFTKSKTVATEWRPPHGRYTEQTIVAAQALGMTAVLWNDDPGDYRTERTAAGLATHITAHATAPEILLLHSGVLATIEMLPRIVAAYRAHGYRFVTVSTLFAQAPISEINHPARIDLR